MSKTDQVELQLEDTFEETRKDEYLIFSVGEEAFGMDINYVIEIVGLEKITVVPDVPDYIKGVINLRGKVVPVMDIRLRLNKPEKEYNDRTCIIVVEINTVFMGLIIDEVLEVVTISQENIMPPPKSGKQKEAIKNRYINGIVKMEDTIRLLVDGEKLLDKSE